MAVDGSAFPCDPMDVIVVGIGNELTALDGENEDADETADVGADADVDADMCVREANPDEFD